ncbi:MAG: hypothetical protein OEZ13_03050 [Spirochaetia bacterium]|nr:hypothetical protein [Spirochaetia bacterium]
MKKVLFLLSILTIGVLFIIGFFFWYRKHQTKLLNAAYHSISNILVSKLSDEDIVQQIFMAYVPLDKPDVLEKLRPGAVFIHPENIPMISDVQDINLLKEQIFSLSRRYIEREIPPPLFAVDQEGGYVSRLKRKVTHFPSSMAVFEASVSRKKPEDLPMLVSFLTCRELKEVGIYWNLAPVTDVLLNVENNVIGARSFGTNPKKVKEFIESYLSAAETGRCLTSLKHFPGHGGTTLDSHVELPIVDKELSVLEKEELYPFISLMKEIPEKIPSIMPAHIIYKKQSPEPVTFSKYWLKDYLRDKQKYTGIIITDDMLMGAVQKYQKDFLQDTNPAVAAIKAGADMILMFSKTGKETLDAMKSVQDAIKSGYLQKSEILKSVTKITLEKLKIGMLDKYLMRAIDKKYEWAIHNEDMLNLILQHSVSQERYIWQTENQLLTGKKLNEEISKNAVKTVLKGVNTLEDEWHSLPVFTDIEKNSYLFHEIKKVNPNIQNLNNLSIDNLKSPVIIAQIESRRFPVRIKNLLKAKNRAPVVIFTAADIFPYSSLGSVLNDNDTLITSFSNSYESQKALVSRFITKKIPANSEIQYKP